MSTMISQLIEGLRAAPYCKYGIYFGEVLCVCILFQFNPEVIFRVTVDLINIVNSVSGRNLKDKLVCNRCYFEMQSNDTILYNVNRREHETCLDFFVIFQTRSH